MKPYYETELAALMEYSIKSKPNGGTMCDFKKNDIIIMAKAITSYPLVVMDGIDTQFIFCDSCGAELEGVDIKEIDLIHFTDCPVLIAHDILATQ